MEISETQGFKLKLVKNWRRGDKFFVCLFPMMVGGSPVTLMVKSLPAVQETQVRTLGWEDPLEKEMATHSRILAWRIPWTEEPVTTVHGVTKSQTRLSDLSFL